MKVGNYWMPTRAASRRLEELGLAPERLAAPQAHLYREAELPKEFVLLARGSAARAALVGVEGEPVARVVRGAERIARERKHLRPGIGSPDEQFAHDDGVVIEALREAGCERPSYKGEPLPWDHHEWFALARGAAFRAAL